MFFPYNLHVFYLCEKFTLGMCREWKVKTQNAKALVYRLRSRHIHSSCLVRVLFVIPALLNGFCRGFPPSLKARATTVPRLVHGSFRKNHIQFIFDIWTTDYVYFEVLTASCSGPQKELEMGIKINYSFDLCRNLRYSVWCGSALVPEGESIFWGSDYEDCGVSSKGRLISAISIIHSFTPTSVAAPGL